MAMWAGRFAKEIDKNVNDFNSSISFDWVMYKEDITGSMAHAAMLGAQGIISPEDSEKIIEGLKTILSDIETGELMIDPAAEDIHMFIEQELTDRIGDAGKRLHTARSRNDQVALDIRMYLKNRSKELKTELMKLIKVIVKLAERHTGTVMPGYTHLQVAQPITFAHHIMTYAWMLERDISRLDDCYKRMDVMPLGSGALAATTYPIDREMVAEALGFAGVTQNSLDGVSDRDFCAELGFVLSLVMTHLSRLSEEIILWCSSEFKFVELDDAFATGSSIMPQKKNPDVAELIRGKTGRVNGNLVTLLTMLKGIPLAYNKDMQEDKQAIFDSIDTVMLVLSAFTPMLDTMTIRKDNMRAAAAKGFINATDCADYLTKRGVPFRDAYKITGQLVRFCVENNLTLETLPLEEYRKLSDVFENDLYDAIDIEACVEQRNVLGGPSSEAVKKQIETFKQKVDI